MGGSEMTPKYRTLEGKNRTLGSKIVERGFDPAIFCFRLSAIYFERRLPYILTTGLIARELKASITLSISLFSLKRLPINLHTHTSLKFWLKVS